MLGRKRKERRAGQEKDQGKGQEDHHQKEINKRSGLPMALPKFIPLTLFLAVVLAAIGGTIATQLAIFPPKEASDRHLGEAIIRWGIVYALGQPALIVGCWGVAGLIPRLALIFTFISLLVYALLTLAVALALLLPLTHSHGAFLAASILYALYHLPVTLQLLHLTNPRLRSRLFMRLVSWPAAVALSGSLFSLFFVCFAPLLPFPWQYPFLALPHVAAFVGLCQSIFTGDRIEEVTYHLDPGTSFPSPVPLDPLLPQAHNQSGSSSSSSSPPAARQLRIAQITDPHLGPFVSAESLQHACRQIMLRQPDLILLTGDFFTLEGQMTPGALAYALEPLKEMRGRVFACLGNHDVESEHARRMTEKGLEVIGALLLVDQQVRIKLGSDHVRIIGIDYYHPRKRHLITDACRRAALSAQPGERTDLKIMLLHDPNGWGYVPAGVEEEEDGGRKRKRGKEEEGEGRGQEEEGLTQALREEKGEKDDYGWLIFSGHTHGGQIGLGRINLASLVGPANGMWGWGKRRLYIGRGQGCRFLFGNFLVRLGIPPETSIITFNWN